MYKSRSEKRTRLELLAPDAATEIFLMDASLTRIASGLGSMQRSVAPGIYKVRYRSGASQIDKLVEVTGDREHQRIEAPPVLFRATAPILNTLTSDDKHCAAAAEIADRPGEHHGTGGELFVFVREVEDRELQTPEISIHSLEGDLIGELKTEDMRTEDRCGGFKLRLDPATYRLRVDDERLGGYELFITVSHGWQTQVFLVMEEIWHEGVASRVPALRSATLSMSECGHGFDPAAESMRLVELARQALAQGRNVISAALMEQLLYGKFDNPMLGIFAAHMVYDRRKPDWKLIETICRNLSNLLGDHPDVQCLITVLKRRKTDLRVDTLLNPPSLRLGWKLAIRASRRRAGIIPPDSPIARVAGDVSANGIWLLHRAGAALQDEQSTLTQAASRRMMQKLMEDNAGQLTEIILSNPELHLTGLEHKVLRNMASVASQQQFPTLDSGAIEVSTAQQVFDRVQAPSSAIASAVGSLVRKIRIKSL